MGALAGSLAFHTEFGAKSCGGAGLVLVESAITTITATSTTAAMAAGTHHRRDRDPRGVTGDRPARVTRRERHSMGIHLP